MTSDKVTIRVNVSAVYETVNVATARAGVKDVSEYLFRALQIAARQSLGKRTLEQVLAEKTDIDEPVSAAVRREMEGYGVRLNAIALADKVEKITVVGGLNTLLERSVTLRAECLDSLVPQHFGRGDPGGVSRGI